MWCNASHSESTDITPWDIQLRLERHKLVVCGATRRRRAAAVDRGERVLLGRQRECATLDRLVEAVRAGQDRAAAVRGRSRCGVPGVTYPSASRPRWELPFAGLHQLCVPLLDRLDGLPVPRRQALGTAFGLTAGVARDRLLVGLTVLGLLAEVGPSARCYAWSMTCSGSITLRPMRWRSRRADCSPTPWA
jgi:hypothetical protein